MSVSSITARRNRLLSLLSDEELQPLLPQLQIVEHACKDFICREDREIEAVYFPCSAIFSIVVSQDQSVAIEIGTVGNEGFLPMGLLLGATQASEATLCCVAGQSLRMDVADLRAALTSEGRLQRILQRASRAYLFLVLQGGACHRSHGPEGRFARLLLETQDRSEQESFSITQEYAAATLGVEQLMLYQVAGRFQQAGLIRYSRSNLQVLDRPALEEAACECYDKVRRHSRRTLDIAHA
jgi:CRP-like cAMP-binding protein